MRRTFTLTQAHELIPLLREELTQLQPAYSELRERWHDLASNEEVPIDDPRVRDLCLNDIETRELLEEVEESLYYFRELGVECRDIDAGLFDFPCLLEDRVAFLCWQVDEDEISHWHEIGQGFFGRRPIFDSTPVEETLDMRLLN